MTSGPFYHFHRKILYFILFFLHQGIYFFPDPWNCKKSIWSNLKKCLNKSTFQSVGLCKINMHSFDNGRKDVKIQTCNMRKRKIADHPKIKKLRISISSLLSFRSPSSVVMGKHNSFGHASGSTCIYNSTTVTRSYFFLPLFNFAIIQIPSNV